MGSVQKLKRIEKKFLGNGIVYAKGVTNEGEIIKGVSFFLVNKQLLTFAMADALWVDENNEPYHFKLDRKYLFIKRLAIGFGKRRI